MATPAQLGYTNIANVSPMNGPKQINDTVAALAPHIGPSKPTPADLPASGNWPGRTFYVESDQTVRVATGTGSEWVIVAAGTVEVPFSGTGMGTGWSYGAESYIHRTGNRVTLHLVLSKSTPITGPQGVFTLPVDARPSDTRVNSGLLVSGAGPGFVGISIVPSGLVSIVVASSTNPSAAMSMRFDFDYEL